MTAKTRTKRHYTDTDITATLTLAAVHGYRKASELSEISETTIRSWLGQPRWREQWAEIQTKQAPRIQQLSAELADQRIRDWDEVEREALNKVHALLPSVGSAGAAANIAAQAAKARKDHADVSARIHGLPEITVHHQHEPQELVVRIMRELGISVDSTAEELPAPSQLEQSGT